MDIFKYRGPFATGLSILVGLMRHPISWCDILTFRMCWISCEIKNFYSIGFTYIEPDPMGRDLHY